MRTIVLAITALWLAAATPAYAQSTDPTSAREHYRKGTQYYDLQRFDEAAREYEAAFQAKEDPALLYNIGQAYRFAKKYDAAAGAFRSYLRRLPKAANRAQVETLLVELTKQAEEQKRAAEEARRQTEEQQRAAEEQKRVADEQVRLRELAEAQARAAEAGAPRVTRREPDLVAAARYRKMKLAGIATAAVGGAALIAGAGLLGAAGAISSRYNHIDSPTPFVPADETRFRTFRLAGAVLAGVGGVAAIAGAAVAVVGARREKESRLVWAPSVAPGWAGLSVAGEW